MKSKTYKAKITLWIDIDLNNSFPQFEDKFSDNGELNSWFEVFKDNEEQNLNNLFESYNVKLSKLDFGFFHPSQFT
tara:strand:- start:2340 stop:2567 length:228 start_codon:yes stop_codon:yes gene_type:complete